MADITNLESEEDLQAQIEEIEALSSIYGDEWCVIDEASRIFCIKISSDAEEQKMTACLQIILPPDYPSTAPPIYQINAAWLRGSERAKLANSLEDIYVEHAGESILYLWVERIRDFLVEKSCSSESVVQQENVNITAEEEVVDDEDVPNFSLLRVEKAHLFMDQANDEEIPPIKNGNPITDRRSTFQPHLAPVVTPSQILDVRNVMVIVSRWYGGILLGPDRFKHINNCARNILMEEGYIASTMFCRSTQEEMKGTMRNIKLGHVFQDEAYKSGAKTKRPKSKKTK
ncbi:protein IMPACT isoform X5 [Girardinichthys multiradiatus]|uniref:protein IMPACT isoform X5 n=1 Tax=Girardinichthys multiradiatus TaxID=208333 RepID=UPI001FABEB71|nr:protein IMPACT isoform X5 [Girardinichthys multiradiatus]